MRTFCGPGKTLKPAFLKAYRKTPGYGRDGPVFLTPFFIHVSLLKQSPFLDCYLQRCPRFGFSFLQSISHHLCFSIKPLCDDGFIIAQNSFSIVALEVLRSVPDLALSSNALRPYGHSRHKNCRSAWRAGVRTTRLPELFFSLFQRILLPLGGGSSEPPEGESF